MLYSPVIAPVIIHDFWIISGYSVLLFHFLRVKRKVDPVILVATQSDFTTPFNMSVSPRICLISFCVQVIGIFLESF